MLATVDQTISGRLVISPHVSHDISVKLRYLRDDPFAVHLAFPAAVSLEGEDIEWVFARELLDDGLYAPSGEGDVHLWPCDADRVVMAFESARGVAMVEFASADLRTFLQSSYRAVPMGQEARHMDVDAYLATLFSE
jgi:hypothetical protein